MKAWLKPRPKGCQICGRDFKPGMKFVDGRHRSTSSWGIMCSYCHVEGGVGLGIGKGQMYDWESGKYLRGSER